MNENISARNLVPVASTGAAGFYLLQVNNDHLGITESLPLHLLISGVENIVPSLPSKTNELPQNLQHYLSGCETEPVVTSITGQELKQLTCKQPKTSAKAPHLDIVPLEEKATTRTISTYEPNYLKQDIPKSSKIIKIKETHQYKRHEIKTIQSTVNILDRIVPSRAIAVLPTALQIRRNCISPRQKLPPRVRFGPVLGVKNKIFHAQADELIFDSAVAKIPIFLHTREEESVVHIDVSDKDKSNWLSLLPLGDENTANVWLYEENSELYGITTKSLAPRTLMALGYSKAYAEMHKLPSGLPVLDLEDALSVETKKWWCFECHQAVASAALLQRHMNIYHKEDKPTRRKYRCHHCYRTFSRLFTLRRHTSRFCNKKIDQVESIAAEKLEPNYNTHPESSAEQNIDYSRIPSDESFQNYSNGLDFPTNLFDTDRIPNLDISGSSKSDADCNPYSVDFKFDNNIEDVDFTNGKKPENTKNKIKNEEAMVPCGHCNQNILKAKKRRHVRDCPARRFECECGLIFTKKDDLAKHIFSEHIGDKPQATAQPKAEVKNPQYSCADCKLNFKRRGMLVNHLWRVHNIVSAAVPLERCVRHYPCTVCPKLYRTAVKRDHHVLKYHPEAGNIRLAPIEVGRRACKPALCTACPRQYVTHAKLLQHMRASHPHLATLLVTRTKRNANTLE